MGCKTGKLILVSFRLDFVILYGHPSRKKGKICLGLRHVLCAKLI